MSEVAEYLLGNTITLQGTFSAAPDENTVVITTKDPTGEEVPYVYGVDEEVIQVSTTVYQINLNPTLVGAWDGLWEGETPAGLKTAEKITFIVVASGLGGGD